MITRFHPVIWVVVSSTFGDLKAEENALARKIHPRLEHHCLLRGFQFEALDLRWASARSRPIVTNRSARG